MTNGRLTIYRILTCILVLFTLVSNVSGDDTKLHLKAAVLENSPPQYSLSANGAPEGFAIDVILEIARIAAADIQFVIKKDYSEMFDALRSGEVDLIPNQGINEQHQEGVAFTSPVESFPVRLFVRSNSKEINGMSDLAGKKVGVVRINVGERRMIDRIGIEAVGFDYIQDALFDLLAGGVDGIVFPEPALLALARRVRLEDRIAAVGPPLIEIERAISVSKANEALLQRLDQAVAQFLGSQAHERIYTKWYGNPSPLVTTRQLVLIMGIALVVVIVGMMGMALWRYRSLEHINVDLVQSIQEREQAELQLQESYDLLEIRVGERTASLATANDMLQAEIDKRTEAEASLRENERFLASVFDSIQDGISVLAPDLTIVHTNKAMQGWYEEHLPLKDKLCFEAYFGRKQPCENCPTVRAQHSRQLEMNEVPLVQKGRETGVLEVFAFPMLDDQGLVTGIVEHVRNVSEKKLAEQALADSENRMKDIIEFLPDPTFVIDMEGRVIAWNRAMERLSGVDKSDMIGKGDHAYAIPFYKEARPMLIDLVLEDDERWATEYPGIKKEDGVFTSGGSFHPPSGGGEHYYAITAGRLFNAEGSLVGAIESVRDITDLKRSEQEREKLIEELKDALAKVRTLSGLLPVCVQCKKIRDDSGYWRQLETYISHHTDADVSHSLCPDCMEKIYGGQDWYEDAKNNGKL